LYLTRKIGETVVINENVRVTVVEVRGKSIKLGITFPPEVSVLREELYLRIQDENRAAAAASVDLMDVLGFGGDGNEVLSPTQPTPQAPMPEPSAACASTIEPSASQSDNDKPRVRPKSALRGKLTLPRPPSDTDS
jgi:carbon storage regulator